MSTTTEPASIPIFRRVLIWSALVAAIVAVVGGVIGFFVAGVPGLVSALIGAAITLVFAGITVLSVILAARLDTMFFMAVILGAWLLKFVLFLGTLFAIRGQAFIHDWMLWGSLVAAVVGTLAVDVVCVVTARIGHVSDVDLRVPAAEVEEETASPSTSGVVREEEPASPETGATASGASPRGGIDDAGDGAANGATEGRTRGQTDGN